jgi:hypothetical protein
MTTIIYIPERGGLGDSTVGCMNAFILSKVLNAAFKIVNGPINYYNYFDIPDKYKLNNIQKYDIFINYDPVKKYNDFFLYDNLNALKNKITVIKAGSNFCQFLYKNKNFKNKIDINEVDVIQYLFKNIIIPKKTILEKLEKYNEIYNIENNTVVHIRCINRWNDGNGENKIFDTSKTIGKFIKSIKQIVNDNEKIILLSDNMECVIPEMLKNNIDIIKIDGDVGHSSKSRNLNYEKTLLDLLIIGTGKNNIISYWSNFSRLGILRTKKPFFIVSPHFNENHSPEKFNYNIEVPELYRKGEFCEILAKEGYSN